MTEPLQSPPTSPTIAKPAKKRKWLNLKGWWWKFPLAFVAFAMMLDSIGKAGGEPGKLPTCDSDYGQQMVKDAVKNGPMNKILNVELIALKDITQRSATEDKVVCQASDIIRKYSQHGFFLPRRHLARCRPSHDRLSRQPRP